jgi:hypothetical protein
LRTEESSKSQAKEACMADGHRQVSQRWCVSDANRPKAAYTAASMSQKRQLASQSSTDGQKTQSLTNAFYSYFVLEWLSSNIIAAAHSLLHNAAFVDGSAVLLQIPRLEYSVSAAKSSFVGTFICYTSNVIPNDQCGANYNLTGQAQGAPR